MCGLATNSTNISNNKSTIHIFLCLNIINTISLIIHAVCPTLYLLQILIALYAIYDLLDFAAFAATIPKHRWKIHRANQWLGLLSFL